MTVKEKIINRLNKGFGFDIPLDAEWKTHEAKGYFARSQGAFSWYFTDMRISLDKLVGSCSSATECLKWKRWIIVKSEREIFEYVPGVTSYDKDYDLLEKLEE